jgi:SAM-dependent methyltransferase
MNRSIDGLQASLLQNERFASILTRSRSPGDSEQVQPPTGANVLPRYRNDWHARHREKTRRAASLVLSQIRRDFAPGSILDIGCGHGDWLRIAIGLGIADVMGCDGPWIDRTQLVIPQSMFRCAILDHPIKFDRRFDLALCTEVGEHLAPSASLSLVDTITSHADLVLFGAAIPYQGGYRHINEKWQSWWAGHFEDRGYATFDLIRPLIWEQPIDFWYKQNTLVYVRQSRTDLMQRAELAAARLPRGRLSLDVVHPEHYTRIASYDSIAFRPFLRNFPRATWRKLMSMVS